MTAIDCSNLVICIKGAGEMASGIAVRLKRSGFTKILLMDVEQPMAVRRSVSFCEAVYEQMVVVEGVEAVLVKDDMEIAAAWDKGQLSVRVDPGWHCMSRLQPDVVVDAILAKKNLGTMITEAPLVIGLGPGFTASKDVHRIIETMRGHDLGRVIEEGSAMANTGIPGEIGGYTAKRVLRAPASGIFHPTRKIKDQVVTGDILGTVADQKVVAEIDGVVRGLIRANTRVLEKVKIGDIDPRGKVENCSTISEKCRAIGGGVLEAILGAAPLLVGLRNQ